jgi:hypothetical protein
MKTEAFFRGIKSANEAVSKLKQSGFDKAFIDMNNNYFHEELANSTSISGFATEWITNDVDKRTDQRFSVNPTINGIDKVEEISDMHYKVIVETSEENKDRLKQIIKDMGGYFDSPNINHRKVSSHTDISEYTLNNMIRKL